MLINDESTHQIELVSIEKLRRQVAGAEVGKSGDRPVELVELAARSVRDGVLENYDKRSNVDRSFYF